MAARPDAPHKVGSPESGANGRRGLVDLTVLAVEDILRPVSYTHLTLPTICSV